MQSLYSSVGVSGLAHYGRRKGKLLGQRAAECKRARFKSFHVNLGMCAAVRKTQDLDEWTTTNSVNQSRKSHAHRVYISSLFSPVVCRQTSPTSRSLFGARE